MMTPEAIDRAAALLVESRVASLPFAGLPEEFRPASEEDAYAVQDALRGRVGALAGYKIGCTTRVMQSYMGIAQPCAGGMSAATILRQSAVLRRADYRRVGVECEIAVSIAADLPSAVAPFDRATVAAAVGACMAAIEVVEDRYVDMKSLGMPTLIADDFCAAGCVLGKPVTDWRDLDLAAAAAAMTVNGTEVGRGTGAQVMGHPLEALVWLVNALARRGRGLQAGDTVLTGSIVEVQWVEAGDQVTVAVDGLGETAARFT